VDAEFKPFTEKTVEFGRINLRLPQVLFEVDGYAAAVEPEAATPVPTVKVPALSASMHLDLAAKEADATLRGTDAVLAPLVSVGPDVDLLLNAPAEGQVPAEMPAASSWKVDWPAAFSLPLLVRSSTAEFGFPRRGLQFGSTAPASLERLDLALSAPIGIQASGIPPADALIHQGSSEPRLFSKGAVEIPAQVDSLPRLREPIVNAAASVREETPGIVGTVALRRPRFGIAAFRFAKPVIPAEVDRLAEPRTPAMDSAGIRSIEPALAASEVKSAPSIIDGLSFTRQKVGLPQRLAALAAPLLAAAGLRKAPVPETSAGSEPLPRTTSTPTVALAGPTLGSYSAGLDASQVPACFLGTGPVERLCPFVDQFALAPVAPADASPVRFGSMEVEFGVNLPEPAADPIGPAAAQTAPVEKLAAPAAADLPHRRLLTIPMTGKDYAASPLLSPLVCDFTAAPMAKVIQK
jgi:hypothetical protein